MVLRSLIEAFKGFRAARKVASNKNMSGLSYMGIKSDTPHIWVRKNGFLNLDLNMHMNQSAYLYTAELARWHFLGATGLLEQAIRNGWYFIAAGQAIKYQREIKPFAKYKVLTTTESVEAEKGFWYINQFHVPIEKDKKPYSLMSLKVCVLDNKKQKMPLDKLLSYSLYSKAEQNYLLEKANAQHPTVDSFINWDNAAHSTLKGLIIP